MPLLSKEAQTVDLTSVCWILPYSDCLHGITIKMLHSPLPCGALFNHSKFKWWWIGEVVFIYSSDIDHAILKAHGLSFRGQSWAVIIEVLHLNSYGPRSSFWGQIWKPVECKININLLGTILLLIRLMFAAVLTELTIADAYNFCVICSIDQVHGLSVREFTQPDVCCLFINNQPVVNVTVFGIPWRTHVN